MDFDEYVSDPANPVPYVDKIGIRMLPEYLVADQRFAARRPEVLVYQTEVLEKDVALTTDQSVDTKAATFRPADCSLLEVNGEPRARARPVAIPLFPDARVFAQEANGRVIGSTPTRRASPGARADPSQCRPNGQAPQGGIERRCANAEPAGEEGGDAGRAGGCGPFREAMFPYEESLRRRVRRWVCRYPEGREKIVTDLAIADVVEALFLNTFEGRTGGPRRSGSGNGLGTGLTVC